MQASTGTSLPAEAHPTPHPSLLWDVFCHVVDNLGDIGVCWRFSADLARRGQRIRLWIDQPEPLRWMAPGALEGRWPGVDVVLWNGSLQAATCEALPVADVWVEAFGCDPPPEMTHALAQQLAYGARAPVWINLEYMSAEGYVERSHRLPSLVSSGPLKGVAKWFFYPGFTTATGGLLREADLPEHRSRFDAVTWLRQVHLPHGPAKRVSVFCYEPPVLGDLLGRLLADEEPVEWLVTSGRSAQAMRAVIEADPTLQRARLTMLPTLPQPAFDQLLWASDLNLVRGEDSLVRAIWAGQPFVWHIYPQHDNAHHVKLAAFLDWLQPPDSLRQFHLAWNGVTAGPLAWPGWGEVDRWRQCVHAARQRLWSQPDLSTQLLDFVAEKR
jgi:uncharacterized repeat protein (TIGR03837 family)